MIRGFYTAYTGMLTDTRRLEVVINDLANVQTTGYKQSRTATETFADLLASRVDAGSDPQPLGALALANVALAPELDLRQGALHETGRELDVALQGDGFFAIQTPSGVHYTRNGSFTRDATGTLTTGTGAVVLGLGGPIRLPAGAVTLDADGTVHVNGATLDRLKIVKFAADTPLEKVGDSEFALADGAPEPAPDGESTVLQRYLEASNVDLTATMTAMLALQRAYDANQRMIQYQDELIARAVNDIAKPVA